LKGTEKFTNEVRECIMNALYSPQTRLK